MHCKAIDCCSNTFLLQKCVLFHGCLQPRSGAHRLCCTFIEACRALCMPVYYRCRKAYDEEGSQELC